MRLINFYGWSWVTAIVASASRKLTKKFKSFVLVLTCSARRIHDINCHVGSVAHTCARWIATPWISAAREMLVDGRPNNASDRLSPQHRALMLAKRARNA